MSVLRTVKKNQVPRGEGRGGSPWARWAFSIFDPHKEKEVGERGRGLGLFESSARGKKLLGNGRFLNER